MNRKLDLKNRMRRLLAAATCAFVCCGAGLSWKASAITNNVAIVDNQFIPSLITVTQGDSVIWTWANTNAALHSTTSFTQLWDTGPQGPGVRFLLTFTNGVQTNFPYYCSVHGSGVMSGSVTVQPAPPTAPTILTQPQSTNVLIGQDASFFVSASGTTPLFYQWAFQGTNIAGATGPSLTIIQAAATNAGNYSVVVTNALGVAASSNAVLTVTPRLRLTVIVNGKGSVRPNLDGALLALGQTYTMTAVPAPGYLFSNWSGTISTNVEKLTFQMQSNMVLQANFAPGQFVGLNGTYRGLFYETGGVALASSGGFTLTTTVKGTFSGSLQMASGRSPFSGRFDDNGTANIPVKRRAGTLLLVLQIDLTGASSGIVGTVSDPAGSFTSPLAGSRGVFNTRTKPAPQAGKYTVVLPANFAATNSPYGDSFGTVSVNGSGALQFSGTLADGTRVSQSSAVSSDGQWPLFAALPGGAGSILSWVAFAATPTNALTGDVVWSRSPSTKSYGYGSPARSTTKPFSGGFMTESLLTGSKYLRPAGTPVLNLAQGELVLAGGDLTSSITNTLTLSPNNRVTNLSSNKMTLTLNLATGTFRGTMADPSLATKRIPFSGVVLQGMDVGRGYFLGTSQAGTVLLQQQ